MVPASWRSSQRTPAGKPAGSECPGERRESCATNTVSTHPINSRYGFGGGFFGDYTDLAVGSDGTFHALYTDSNSVQTVTWFYGLEFTPTPIHQQEISIASDNY